MGRTNPTFRDALRAIEERWQAYRRALRRRDQPRFDQLFAYVREHADASGVLNHQNPIVPMLLSIDLEQERRLDDYEERLEELESVLATLSHRDDIPDPDDAKVPHTGSDIGSPGRTDCPMQVDGAELVDQGDTETTDPPSADGR